MSSFSSTKVLIRSWTFRWQWFSIYWIMYFQSILNKFFLIVIAFCGSVFVKAAILSLNWKFFRLKTSNATKSANDSLTASFLLAKKGYLLLKCLLPSRLAIENRKWSWKRNMKIDIEAKILIIVTWKQQLCPLMFVISRYNWIL